MNAVFNFLAVDIGFLRIISTSYFKSAKSLYKGNNPQESLYPFCLLATTAAELFLKVIIASEMCLKENSNEHTAESIGTIITTELKNLNHNIKKLVEKSNIQKDLSIGKIEEVSNSIVSDYRIYFDSKKMCCLKDSESIRFGSLANKKDLAVSASLHFNSQIIDFLTGIDKLSWDKFSMAINTFKK